MQLGPCRGSAAGRRRCPYPVQFGQRVLLQIRQQGPDSALSGRQCITTALRGGPHGRWHKVRGHIQIPIRITTPLALSRRHRVRGKRLAPYVQQPIAGGKPLPIRLRAPKRGLVELGVAQCLDDINTHRGLREGQANAVIDIAFVSQQLHDKPVDRHDLLIGGRRLAGGQQHRGIDFAPTLTIAAARRVAQRQLIQPAERIAGLRDNGRAHRRFQRQCLAHKHTFCTRALHVHGGLQILTDAHDLQVVASCPFPLLCATRGSWGEAQVDDKVLRHIHNGQLILRRLSQGVFNFRGNPTAMLASAARPHGPLVNANNSAV